ncbi:MAG TPA: methyltransferase domain-containing protein [Candidatus Limnocylindria bacterium]|nr:methyltransferase domain-containing protein [Candidatus Limnocylindria bacterium]
MMRLPLSRRSAELELLDLGVLPPAELATNLDDLARINRLPGGAAASTDAVALLLDGAGGRVLDVGTGRADIPLRLAARGWSVVALDSDPEVLAIARRAAAAEAAVEVVAGDGRSLPFPDAAFDVAHCSLLIHHLDRGEAVALLREMRRVARRGVVVNDLRRGWVPLLATAVVVVVLGRCRATRHDGLLSVRRAYTVDELDELLGEAGLQVRHRSPAWMPRVVTVATR